MRASENMGRMGMSRPTMLATFRPATPAASTPRVALSEPKLAVALARECHLGLALVEDVVLLLLKLIDISGFVGGN